MAPFGSVPNGGRRSSIDRSAAGNSGLPSSLPRFEGFGSTLGGFARSPQVSRVQPSLLRRDNEQEDHAVPANQTESAFVESLQSPLLTSDVQATADYRNQSARPSSLLARSLGTLNDVFSRQVDLSTASVVCKLLLTPVQPAEEAGRTVIQWNRRGFECSSRRQSH